MAFEATERPHERIGVRYGRILAFVAGFLVFTGVLMTLLGLFYRDRIRSAHIIEPLRAFPGPELQPNPQQDYTNFRTGQDAQLQGYSWVDKDKTLLHVPIDRAMSYVAARGQAAYAPLEPATPGAPLPPTPADGWARRSDYPHVAPYGVHP